MVKNVVRDGGGMGENALGSVAGEMTDSVSGYRYISLDTLQSFTRFLPTAFVLCIAHLQTWHVELFYSNFTE